MSLQAKYAVHRTAAVLLRLLSLFFVVTAFRHVAHADPVSAIGAGIGGITSLIGGIMGSGAAKSAAATQQGAANQVAGNIANATAGAQTNMGNQVGIANSQIGQGVGTANQTLGDIFGQQSGLFGNLYGGQTGNIAPYLQAGNQGLQGLMSGLAPGGSLSQQFTAPTAEQAAQTPGYEFTLNQGLQALQRSAAAGGSLQGGGTAKAILQYANGLSSANYQQTFNNALNTFQTNHNNNLQGLLSLAGLGQTGVNQQQAANSTYGQQFGNASQNYGNLFSGNTLQGAFGTANNSINGATYGGNIGLQGAEAAGNATLAGANAKAAGQVGSANAWSSALGGIGNAAQFAGLSSLMQNGYGGGFGGGGYGGFTPYSQASPWNPAAGYSMPSYIPAPTPSISLPQIFQNASLQPTAGGF